MIIDFSELIGNKIFLSVMIALIISQSLKFFNKIVYSGSIDIRKLWETGGMPSSHAALATSLAFATILVEGITTLSLVAFFLCLIVIRDAFGLRQETGKHAKAINIIVKEIRLKTKLDIKKLSEVVGHNFIEVFFGILVGILVTLSVFFINMGLVLPIIMMILTTLYYALPGLVANMVPIFVKNRFKKLDIPVDLGRKINNKRLLGDNKTIRGFVCGIISGAIVGLLQFLVSDIGFFSMISYIEYDFFTAITVGSIFGLGALVGDSLESFVKRQLKIKPGKPFIPFDQMDYVIGIAFFSLLFKPLTTEMLIILLLIGPILSFLTTRLGYLLKIRKEKW